MTAPWATLVRTSATPAPGFPPYSIGARLPRLSPAGAVERARPVLRRDAAGARAAEARAGPGGIAAARVVHGISRALALVATFRTRNRALREPGQTTGPLLWEHRMRTLTAAWYAPLFSCAFDLADPDLDVRGGAGGARTRRCACSRRQSARAAGPARMPRTAVVEWVSSRTILVRCGGVPRGHGLGVRWRPHPVVACPARDTLPRTRRGSAGRSGVLCPRRLVTCGACGGRGAAAVRAAVARGRPTCATSREHDGA